MKKWALNNRIYMIGGAVGAFAGFFYWKYVGCTTGTCSITANPIRSTIYFALMGALLFGVFKPQPKPGKT